MLEQLCRHPGTLLTRQDLLKEIWGSEQVTDSGYLRLYMSQLRRKLEVDPSAPAYLITEPGMGYRLLLTGALPDAARPAQGDASSGS
jgi:two-component system KDP operon response regulator KdpE